MFRRREILECSCCDECDFGEIEERRGTLEPSPGTLQCNSFSLASSRDVSIDSDCFLELLDVKRASFGYRHAETGVVASFREGPE